MPATPVRVMSIMARKTQIFLLLITAMVVISAVWNTFPPKHDGLTIAVDNITSVALFETRWLYTSLLVFTGIFPFLFGFIPKPSFYKAMPGVFLANLPVTLLFILWDIWFTHRGVWGFSEHYTLGSGLLGLPMEECLFFIIIPLSCTFIYWSINTVVPKEPLAGMERMISGVLILFFFAVGILNWGHIYTSTTAFLAGFLLIYHMLFIPGGYRGRFYLAYLVTCIPFLIVNGILTGSFTESPVVMYHPEAIVGWRVVTVPVEDFSYSFLLLLSNITLFEWLQARRAVQ